MITLRQIAGLFGRYANTTFGGGSATIAVLEQQLVTRRGWLDAPAVELGYALSRLTPGTNLLAFCAASGWTLRRWPGALVALVAASLPCSLLAVLATAFYDELSGNSVFQAAIAGALAATVAIMVATAWVFAEPHLKAAPVKAAVILPATAALSLGAGLSAVKILLIAAAIGLAWPVPKPAPVPP